MVRNLSPLDLMKAIDDYNIFLPTGTAKSWPGCIEPHRIPKPEVSW
jgi:hypothetical protein